MIYSKSGDIPSHQYCYVEQKYITNGERKGVEPCVWFGIVGKNESDDTHSSKEQAEAVCELLKKEGFGGDGQVFPISTRVDPVFESENP